jgi:hypothetical protein
MRRSPLGGLTRTGLLVLAVVLGGCGSSSPTVTAPTVTSDVSIRTQTGIRYAFEITERGKRECSTQTYAVIGAHSKPFTQTTRSCGPTGESSGAILIQVARPKAAFILDRPASGCTPVRVTSGSKRSIAAPVRCSATKPTLRLTVLPATGVLRIEGIAGVTRLSLRDYPCSSVCSRQLVSAR